MILLASCIGPSLEDLRLGAGLHFLRMTSFSDAVGCCIYIGFGKLWIGALVKSRVAVAFAIFVLASSAVLIASAQDSDKTAVPAAAAKKNPKKDQKKDQKKDEGKAASSQDKDKKDEEKKPGMNAETFSGLKFRSIGPAVASGRVMSIAVNPKNKFEYYVGVASGGVWKTVNDGTTWTPLFDKRGVVFDWVGGA